ncbi:MAG TPA: hypothetical protein VGK30_00150 [Candidatus Binatia bacterium]|jgi:hypothetical protein
MHIFINEREVGTLDAVGTTVGEMIEALGVHVDPDEIVTSVELDGVRYSAGEEDRYARRAAASVGRLVLGTTTPAAFAADMRGELAAALEIVAAKIERVVELFHRGEDRDANTLLAALLEELRLALVLEHQVTILDGHTARDGADSVAAIAPELLAAQEQRAWAAVSALLDERLGPALRAWAQHQRALAAR